MIKRTSTLAIVLGTCLTMGLLPAETVHGAERTSDFRVLDTSDSTRLHVLTTNDGSTNIGRIVEKNGSEIRFRTAFGDVTIPITKIREIRIVPSSSIKDGHYWFPNPNATRLYFAPTARMLKRGEGYFADYYVFFPALTLGLADNITIGGGMSVFPGVGAGDQLKYFTPKVGSRVSEKIDLAAGALLVSVDGETSGIFYGVGTYGTSDASLTGGIGYGFVGNDVDEKPMIMFGGEQRLSRRTSFVTENWIIPGLDHPLFSYGVRFFGEKMSVDLAMITIIGEEGFVPGVPYIDFVFGF